MFQWAPSRVRHHIANSYFGQECLNAEDSYESVNWDLPNGVDNVALTM
jgi:hypothetical protein